MADEDRDEWEYEYDADETEVRVIDAQSTRGLLQSTVGILHHS